VSNQLLQGKTAVITGGGRGIGKVIALVYADHGAEVVVTSRTQAQVDSVAQEIQAKGGRCLPVTADISQEDDVARLFEQCRQAFQKVDILVNNAGITLEHPFMELSPTDFRNLFEVNVMGTVLCTRAVLPTMLERNSGRIINVASGAGLRGLAGNSAYSVSKAGVVGLTHSLADELQTTGIRVNVICPGPVDTEMLQQSGVKDYVLQAQSTILAPREIAGIALFLASEYSTGMSSQVLVGRLSNRW
jgi:NAD(P)-dependent dehydrogenase (short-subunit alcohol dehydrogenase family)